jgi:hypothetical protein
VQQTTISEPVFGLVQQDFNPQPKSGNGLKRNATPISVQNLGRSKRKAMMDKGFKPTSPALSNNKLKGKKDRWDPSSGW